MSRNTFPRALRPAALLAVTVCLVEPIAAQDWSIEESHAPVTTTLEYVATEGTWMQVDVSPDGRHLAFDLLGHIYEMPVEGGDATALTEGRSWNAFPRYSPDGARLAFTSDRGGSDDIWVLDRASGELTNVSDRSNNVYGASWSADGEHLFAAGLRDVTNIDAYMIGLRGTSQTLITGELFSPLNHFIHDPDNYRIFYEHRDQQLPSSGSRIRSHDTETGETELHVQRPGGAVSPALSPDGRWLAYVHRDDQSSELVLHDLETEAERVLLEGLDRDRQDYRVYHHAGYPGMDRSPDGSEIFLSTGGRIVAVAAADGSTRVIPFRAPVRRVLDQTIRFSQAVGGATARTRVHRWAYRIPDGILFEALGDLWLRAADGSTRNVTDSPEHEAHSVYDAASGTLYYAAWSDDAWGGVFSRPLSGGTPTRLSSRAGQYGALALSDDGRWLAYMRDDGRSLVRGRRLEWDGSFELVLRGPDAEERVLTDVSQVTTGYRQSPTARVDVAREHVYYTSFESDTLKLKRVGFDGQGETTLYAFPHASRAVLSPGLDWIAFNEYHRTYLTPVEFIGKAVTVSGEDGAGYARRVSADRDGLYHMWSADGSTLTWTRGPDFVEIGVTEVIGEPGADPPTPEPRATDIALELDVATPTTTVALTGARVITVNPERAILEDATIVVEGNRISAIGTDVVVPPGARVFDLAGHTIMPGIVDVHAHYGRQMAATGTVEQRPARLQAALAHGVTTMYEVAGSNLKDFWTSDMILAGRIDAPRLYSTGSLMYGARRFRPKQYRAFDDLESVREHVRLNKAFGATALKDYITGSRRIRHQLATVAREEGLNLIFEPGGDAQLNLARVLDGQAGFAHGMGFTPMHDDIIRFLSATEAGITPTLIVTLDGPSGEAWFHQSERLWEDPKIVRFSRREEIIANFRRTPHFFEDDFFHPELVANLKRLWDAGVSVQLGAHGQMPGLDAHWEMELFTHGGFTPHEAIEIATLRGAWHQGLDADIGSLEPGKLADLVIMSENPLEDIRNSRSILYVMKNGVLYDGADASRVYPGPVPAKPYYFQR